MVVGALRQWLTIINVETGYWRQVVFPYVWNGGATQTQARGLGRHVDSRIYVLNVREFESTASCSRMNLLVGIRFLLYDSFSDDVGGMR